MLKKFVFILGLFCCCLSQTEASENLIENLEALSNTVVIDGVVSQQYTDPADHGSWKLQAIYNNLKHNSFGDTQSYENLILMFDDKTGFISTRFTTPSDLENLAYFRFGTNGIYIDTVVQFDIKDIMPNITYTLQWRVLNNTQGEVSWTDMSVVHCDDGYGLHNGECVPLCTGGMRYIKTSNGLLFNLYPVVYSTPALHVKRDETVCHAVLAPGAAKNSININHNGQIYHTVD